MTDVNRIIAYNIVRLLNKRNGRLKNLCEFLGVTFGQFHLMLNENLNLPKIQEIAKYLDCTSEDLLELPPKEVELDPVKNLLRQVSSDEAKEALKIADEVAEMICFHSRVRRNAEKMSQTFEDF